MAEANSFLSEAEVLLNWGWTIYLFTDGDTVVVDAMITWSVGHYRCNFSLSCPFLRPFQPPGLSFFTSSIPDLLIKVVIRGSGRAKKGKGTFPKALLRASGERQRSVWVRCLNLLDYPASSCIVSLCIFGCSLCIPMC